MDACIDRWTSCFDFFMILIYKLFSFDLDVFIMNSVINRAVFHFLSGILMFFLSFIDFLEGKLEGFADFYLLLLVKYYRSGQENVS